MFKKKSTDTVEIVQKKPRKKIKKWKIVVAVIVLFVIVRGVINVFAGAKEMIPSVDTADVIKGEITATLDTSGTITSELTRVYASPVTAQVGEVPIAVGENVHKGDYLLTYDTTSLQKTYDIAELQAKAEEATGNDSLAKSNESAADLATSSNDISSLKGQIDAVEAEISSLESQANGNEKDTNKNASRQAKVAEIQAEIDKLSAEITALEQKKAEGTISEKEQKQLADKKEKKKEQKKDLKEKEKKLRDTAELANNRVDIQSELSKRNTRLSELQSKLAEAESKNMSAEAGILTEAAKANITYSKKASQLTLEQTADELSAAKAGITADFDGIITEVQASPGTMAAEGNALITLASSNDMCIQIPVSKYNLENIKLDQKAVVTFQEKEYEGKVSYISKIAQKSESGGSMVDIKVHINKPDESLILGLDAKVSIELGSQKDAMIVPISAVNSDTTGDFVYIINEGIVAKKYVTVGMASKEEIEIKDGLEVGEKVITLIDSTIMEGMPVTENVPADTEELVSTEE